MIWDIWPIAKCYANYYSIPKFQALDPPEVIAIKPKRDLSYLIQSMEHIIIHLTRKHSFDYLRKTRTNRTFSLKWKIKWLCNTTWVDVAYNMIWLIHKIKQTNKQNQKLGSSNIEKFTTFFQTSFIFFFMPYHHLVTSPAARKSRSWFIEQTVQFEPSFSVSCSFWTCPYWKLSWDSLSK